MIRFNDGISFDTSGSPRITRRHDGLYVVGLGQLCAVDTYEEGRRLIQEMLEMCGANNAKPSRNG